MWWIHPEIRSRVVRFGCPVLDVSVASRELLAEFLNLRRRRFRKLQKSLEQDLRVYHHALHTLQAALDVMTPDFSDEMIADRYPLIGAIRGLYDEMPDFEQQVETCVESCADRLEAVTLLASPGGR